MATTATISGSSLTTTTTPTTKTSATSWESLEARVVALERKRYECPDDVLLVTDEMRRARHAVEGITISDDHNQPQQQHTNEQPPATSHHFPLYSAKWKWVPKEYYSWSFEQRAQALSAPSTWHLCKSLLLENHRLRRNNKETASAPTTTNTTTASSSSSSSFDPTNPQFVLVVLQYETTLDVKKLVMAVRSWRPLSSGRRLDINDFDFRVASLEDNDVWTGYSHGAVTPLGMLRQSEITIVLSSDIVPLHFFWMGGGHVQLKLGLAVSEFLQATRAKIADIASPRNPNLRFADDDE